MEYGPIFELRGVVFLQNNRRWESIECSRYFEEHLVIANVEKLRFVEICRLFIIVHCWNHRQRLSEDVVALSNTRHFPNILPNLRQHLLLLETPPVSKKNMTISYLTPTHPPIGVSEKLKRPPLANTFLVEKTWSWADTQPTNPSCMSGKRQ